VDALSGLKFYTLVGFRDVWAADDAVVGAFDRSPDRLWRSERPRVAMDCANLPGATESIVKFTQQYGPIRIAWEPHQRTRCFAIGEWLDCRESVRYLWRNPRDALYSPVRDGAHVTYDEGGVAIWLSTLFAFMCIEVATCCSERLRVCALPGCPTPFFYAGSDLRQIYCSRECSDVKQRESKRKWWSANKAKSSSVTARASRRRAKRKG
jgi:hypothetical protein